VYRDGDLVFARPDGRWLDPDAVGHRFAYFVRKLTVKPIRLHDLRHTHASIALAVGVHPKVVQEHLGHSSIQITLDRYSHLVPSMQDDAATRIGALINPSRAAGG
jgi:integrase